MSREQRFFCRFTPGDPLKIESESEGHLFQKVEREPCIYLSGHIESGQDIGRDIKVELDLALVGDPEIQADRFHVVIQSDQGSEAVSVGRCCIGSVLLAGGELPSDKPDVESKADGNMGKPSGFPKFLQSKVVGEGGAKP